MDAARYFEEMHLAMSSQKPEYRLVLSVKVQDLGGADAYLELRQEPVSGKARVFYSTMGRQKLNFQLVRKGWQSCHNASGELTGRFPATADGLLAQTDFSAFVRDDALDSGRMARILDVLAHTAGGCGTVSPSAAREGALITVERFVGRSAQNKLEGIGIHTIGQLAACNVELLKPILGEKYAIQIHDYACGIDPSPVAEREPINKGYGNSTTLSRDVDDLDTAFTVLLSLCETVGARLRADHVICDCVCVEIKDWDFHVQSHQTTLNSPTDSTTVLYENACRLLKEFWDRTPLRLIGVRATKISDDEFSQISLFESEQSKKMKEMEKAVDQIRSKFGTDIIKRASFLKKDSIVDHAASKQKHLSHSALKEDEKGSEGGGSGKVRDYKRGWNETY